ncbi:helix-turn-helix transcriptional regulator [Oceanicola sp. S124]|uniref:helix-turn-helix transcriptional regulator n=1 Tax=Oceanicola sp. S124 TaxID=1042378 RepID=UPI00030E6658|nr:LuxR C-terminal-related transcriptional regulator [Oceanicola sp. S124]
MLDMSFARSGTQSGLIDALYDLIVDQGDLVAALERIMRATVSVGLRLNRCGRGEDILLATLGDVSEAGRRAGSCHVSSRADAYGRRLELTLCSADAASLAASGFLDGLLLHLDRAITLSSRLENADVERSLGSELLGRLSIGTVFLDAERRVVAMTGAAESLVGLGNGLHLRAGMLTASFGHEDRALQTAIRQAMEAGPDEVPTVLQIQRQRDERTLGVVVQPVARGARNGGIVCSVVIRDGEAANEPQVDMLRRLFELTPAEAVLTSILSKGHTLDEASEELAISRNTARAHLRSIFSKCGINRQTELVRLVLSSVAMLGTCTPGAPRQAA